LQACQEAAKGSKVEKLVPSRLAATSPSSSTATTTNRLVSVPDSRAREGVALGVVPLVECDTGIGSLVRAGELDCRARISSATGLDLQLEALDVELRLADVALVQANVLDADEVLASGDVLLNSPLEPILLPRVPGGVRARGAGVLEAALHDLDPVAGAVVALDGARRLGDVDEARAGVLDELVVEDLEAELVTDLDGVGGGVAGGGALVAAEIVAVHQLAGDRGVVRVAVLAGVGVLAADGSTVDDEAVEDVMRIGTEGRDESEKSYCVDHVERLRNEANRMKVGRMNGIECLALWMKFFWLRSQRYL
jgi:hypothetical protein